MCLNLMCWDRVWDQSQREPHHVQLPASFLLPVLPKVEINTDQWMLRIDKLSTVIATVGFILPLAPIRKADIATESAKSSLTSLDLRPTYHNKTRTMIKDGDRAVQVLDSTDKETNNQTGEVHLSHIHMEISGQWNRVDHECMVDEDCGELKYCLYEIENSKCLPCIPTDMPCTIDEECCSDQMCVWGQCTVNATAGTEGTICQGQSDCRPDLCCAFQRELLFPVCNPRPEKGESCWNHSNLLMDMLAWDQEGPRDHCPCADDLQCIPRGRGSVCGE
ncbi:dickkopf-related protein 3b isoform X1 [Acanthopagrus latus]|uniref:dickkopf-related protein 3b isoform X1 n=1 Tax=Acanthopagrus latus TaxID=8177 RepID=UPI00187BDB7C|nr:dickkopf-related protein 3b isoform X1 [Acanthopagrus latus]